MQREAMVIDAMNARVQGLSRRRELLVARIEEEDKTYLNNKSTNPGPRHQGHYKYGRTR